MLFVFRTTNDILVAASQSGGSYVVDCVRSKVRS